MLSRRHGGILATCKVILSSYGVAGDVVYRDDAGYVSIVPA